MLVLLTLIWGTSYILIKKGLIAFNAAQLACLRISISFLFSIPIAVYGFKTIPRSKYGALLAVGVISSGLPAYLFALSMTKSESGVIGILNSLSPLWTIVVGYYLFHVTITRQKIMGVLIGFAGALVLVLGKPGAGFKIDAFYSFLPVVATFCYGLGTNITKEKLQHENPVYGTALSLCFVGLPVSVLLFFTGAPAVIASGNAWLSLLCVTALAIFGTIAGWMLFYRLVQRTDALFAASVTYLVPIVAIAWGFLDGEKLSVLQFGGMGLILLGVYFTTKPTPPNLPKGEE